MGLRAAMLCLLLAFPCIFFPSQAGVHSACLLCLRVGSWDREWPGCCCPVPAGSATLPSPSPFPLSRLPLPFPLRLPLLPSLQGVRAEQGCCLSTPSVGRQSLLHPTVQPSLAAGWNPSQHLASSLLLVHSLFITGCRNRYDFPTPAQKDFFDLIRPVTLVLLFHCHDWIFCPSKRDTTFSSQLT